MFYEHFIPTSALFEAASVTSTNVNNNAIYSDPTVTFEQPFHFKVFTSTEVCKVLEMLDFKKSARPDSVESDFLKLAADFIASPLKYLFHLSISLNEIPPFWKSAFALPSLKSNDPTQFNNYRPILKPSALAKILEFIGFF